MNEQLELLFELPKPRVVQPRRTEPTVWVARLLVLRERQLRPETVVREIRLRQGLNILWARPSPIEGNRLYDGRLTGHTAGKTTFCRLIRYLLGETRFATPRIQERIREGELRDGWVIGEVVIAGEPWVVGRPFALNVHPFARRGGSVEEAIAEGGAFQDYLDALSAATVSDLPVKTLPSSTRFIDWALLLTWLTRDQEARFSGVDDWRASRSESDSPNPAAVDRSMVVRAVLDVVSDGEAELQQSWEELARSKEVLEREAAVRGELAADSRERLAAKLALPARDLPRGPLFTQAAAAVVRARQEALTQALAEGEQAAAAVAIAEKAKDEAAEARGRAAARLELLQERLEEARNRPVASPAARGKGRPEGQGPLGPAAPGRCNVPLVEAKERGCPLAQGAPIGLEERRGSHRAHEEEEGLADLEAKLAAATAELAGAALLVNETKDAHARLHAAFVAERERLAIERATGDELARLLSDVRRKEGNADQVDEHRTQRTSRMQELSDRKAALRKTHAEASGRLSRRFEGILQALLGEHVRGEVKVSRESVEPVVMVQGERESAAMDTVKVLAFDLAALTLGIEGHGHFPGFLLHDGPREADMDQAIYERLFLYARELEDAFGPDGSIGFQYIVTTTTPPPEQLQRAPWLLQPVLNASTPEGRLLKMDL
jgi:hypothetical protein